MKKTDKKQMMAAAAAQFATGKLQRIENIEPLELYVKVFTAKEFRELAAQGDSLAEKYSDGYGDERRMMLELFDDEGNRVFDPDDLDDVRFMAQLPFAVRSLMSAASARANSGDWLKNLPAAGKSLS